MIFKLLTVKSINIFTYLQFIIQYVCIKLKKIIFYDGKRPILCKQTWAASALANFLFGHATDGLYSTPFTFT